MRDHFIRTYKTNWILKLDDNTAGIEVIGKKYGDRFIYKIDWEEIEKVKRDVWYYHEGYCVTGAYEGKQINLAQVIMGKPPEGHTIHHVNGDKTDYRKTNLRIVSWAVNNYFKKSQGNTTTGITGVHRYKNGRWVANHGSKKICCKSLQEAIKIRKPYEDKMKECLESGDDPSTSE